MPKPGFTKITSSETRLYGPPALLLCGFSANTQSKFESLLAMLGLSAMHLIWASADQSDKLLQKLFYLENGSGRGDTSDLPRAIIAGGIKEKELHQLMTGCRKAGMKQALWATLTPTSEKWSLAKLLKELQRERNALADKKPVAGH